MMRRFRLQRRRLWINIKSGYEVFKVLVAWIVKLIETCFSVSPENSLRSDSSGLIPIGCVSSKDDPTLLRKENFIY
jgi:hypothetical protein